MGATITGLDDCLRWIDKLPENCLKASRTALRESAKEVTKDIRKRVPRRWRKLVKYYVVKTSDGKLTALPGLWNGHQHQGHQNKKAEIDDWFKAYWANYGTLTHRDPNHTFKKAVRPKTASSKRRNDVGQPRQNFFEAATEGYENKFFETFSRSLAKQESTFYEK